MTAPAGSRSQPSGQSNRAPALDVDVVRLHSPVHDKLEPGSRIFAKAVAHGLVGGFLIGQTHPEQGAAARIQGGLFQLARAHFAQSLEARNLGLPAHGTDDFLLALLIPSPVRGLLVA